MERRISILTPSRKRPLRLTELYLSALDTASNPDSIEFIVYTDYDDDSYKNLSLKQMKILQGERISISEAWNVCSDNATGDLHGLYGDDIVFRTQGWDRLLLNAVEQFPDKIGYFYTDDGTSEGRNFGTHGFLHRNWIDTVGYFVPPYFTANEVDRWLDDSSKELGRHVFVEALAEHMHQGFGKAPADETYTDAIEREQADRNAERYRDLRPQRKEDVRKLKAFMADFDSNSRN